MARGPRDLEGNSVPRGQEKSQQGDAWKGRSEGQGGTREPRGPRERRRGRGRGRLDGPSVFGVPASQEGQEGTTQETGRQRHCVRRELGLTGGSSALPPELSEPVAAAVHCPRGAPTPRPSPSDRRKNRTSRRQLSSGRSEGADELPPTLGPARHERCSRKRAGDAEGQRGRREHGRRPPAVPGGSARAAAEGLRQRRTRAHGQGAGRRAAGPGVRVPEKTGQGDSDRWGGSGDGGGELSPAVRQTWPGEKEVAYFV